MVVVLNRAMIRNSTATLFVDGSYVASSKVLNDYFSSFSVESYSK